MSSGKCWPSCLGLNVLSCQPNPDIAVVWMSYEEGCNHCEGIFISHIMFTDAGKGLVCSLICMPHSDILCSEKPNAAEYG